MNKHLPRIDALRGLLALTVLAYHAANQFEAARGFANGFGAVVAFFVISGFVLARSLEANSDSARYFRNRFFRLFPAGAVSVALLTALYFSIGFYTGYKPSFEPINVLLNMLMIKSDINASMWSMTVECFATPLILGCFLVGRRYGTIPLYIAIAILFGLSFWGPYVHALGGITNLAPLYAFPIGILIHFKGQNILARLPNSIAAIAIIFSGLIFFFCGFKKQTAPILALETVSASVIVAITAYRNISLLRILDLKALGLYGDISYSFYLLHMIGVGAAFRLINAGHMPQLVGFSIICFAAIVITTSLAYLSWRIIELPPMRFARSWKGSKIDALRGSP
jgi:peptidoglycan/LPS O-acetylase OafA/YrhL